MKIPLQYLDAMPLQSSTQLTNPFTTVFLETGTFHGGGVSRALSEGYKKVISIEIHEPLYQANLLRFQDEINKGLVELYFGDSAYIIGDIAASIQEPILFWFDAHDQTMNDAGVGDCKCPIIKELRSIIDKRSIILRRLDVLIIDDMRLIEKPEAGWSVNTGDLYETIWDYNKDFAVTREEGYVNHDILYCKNKYLA